LAGKMLEDIEGADEYTSYLRSNILPGRLVNQL
jgi:hypothetical protein